MQNEPCFKGALPLIVSNCKQPLKDPTAVTYRKSTVLTSALVAALAISAPVSSYGFTEFARGALTLETEARLTYDSFIIGAPKFGDDDFYARVHPELKYSRRAGLAQINAFAGVSVIRYNTYDQWDSEDFSAGLTTELPLAEGSRLSGNFDVGYTEATVVDYDVLDRVRQKTLSANANFSYRLGLKTSLNEAFDYTDTTRGSSYSDQETFGNNLSFVYSDFLDGTTFRLSHGYSRTTTSGENFLGSGLDQTSNSLSAGLTHPIVGPLIGDVVYGYRMLDRSAHENLAGQDEINGSFFSINIRGPFLPPRMFPKVQSGLSLTYSNSRSPGINDTGSKTLTGNMHLSWDARERTKFTLSMDRSVSLSANDLSVEITRYSFGVTEAVGLKVSLNAQTSYTSRKYRNLGRKDGTIEAALNANYQMNKYWNAGAGYTYQNNDTNSETNTGLQAYRMRAFDYERHTVSVYVRNTF